MGISRVVLGFILVALYACSPKADTKPHQERIDANTMRNLPSGETVMIDLTDTDRTYHVDLTDGTDAGRVYVTVAKPLDEFLRETSSAETGMPNEINISSSHDQLSVIVEAGCDGLPPAGCGTLACSCRGDDDCNRMFCSGNCKSAWCSGSGDSTYCWCSTIFFKR